MPNKTHEYAWHNRYERDTRCPIPTEDNIDRNWKIVKSIANPDGGFNGGIDLVEYKYTPGMLAVRKRLLPRPGCVKHDWKRWRREMLILRRLKHHNIPTYFDGFFTPERGSIYMQACRLGSVSDFLDNNRKQLLSVEMQEFFLWHVLHEVAEAILYMQTGYRDMTEARSSKHSKQHCWVSLVHGDIRPDQIFINNTESDATPRVLLGDFGFAQFIMPWHSVEKHDGPGGSSSTKAPEFPAQISKATDVFALGVTAQLYLAPHEKVKCGLKPGWLRRLAVSHELEELVCSCVSVHPGDRPTIQKVLEKLERGLQKQNAAGLNLSMLKGPLFKCLYPFPRTAYSEAI
jgi:serine/threonine protein kinase